MREITDHYDGHGLTESLTIEADEPGPGGASHNYTVRITTTQGDIQTDISDAVEVGSAGECTSTVAKIHFQKGPRNVKGSTPGVVESVLLAIVIDRMRSFNEGEYRCRENALVMTKCEEALHWLKHRSDDRARRKVLGTYAK